jgi:hypothetical protein
MNTPSVPTTSAPVAEVANLSNIVQNLWERSASSLSREELVWFYRAIEHAGYSSIKSGTSSDCT